MDYPSLMLTDRPQRRVTLRVLLPLTPEACLQHKWFNRGPMDPRTWRNMQHKLNDGRMRAWDVGDGKGLVLTGEEDGHLLLFFLTGRRLPGIGRQIGADLYAIASLLDLARPIAWTRTLSRVRLFTQFGWSWTETQDSLHKLEYTDGWQQ